MLRARWFALLATALIGFGVMATGLRTTAAEPPGPPGGPSVSSRRDGLPRKVLLGSVISGYEVFSLPLEKRLDRMDELVKAMSAQARASYPGKPLDLAVLPETFLARPGGSLAQQAVQLDEVLPRIAACARRHKCYLVVPLLLRERDLPSHISNAALLVDRGGGVAGIYRKVHLVAPQGSDVLENGTTPGRAFPVFECDFGRVGIQICFDLLYPDGWQALARQGAEIVALPSASPETVHPCLYALRHRYYIVSAAPRDHAAVFSPLGLIEAQVTREAVLVHQIDLSYAILHWEAVLEEGKGLRRRFGDKVGFHYYRPEDAGIFWSNDPETPIARMIASLGLSESDANTERVRRLQEKARGGPPEGGLKGDVP
jgi:predicted amidohydrolase